MSTASPPAQMSSLTSSPLSASSPTTSLSASKAFLASIETPLKIASSPLASPSSATLAPAALPGPGLLSPSSVGNASSPRSNGSNGCNTAITSPNHSPQSANNNSNANNNKPVNSSLQEICKAMDDHQNPQLLKVAYQKIIGEYAAQQKELKTVVKQLETAKKERDAKNDELLNSKKENLRFQTKVSALEDSIQKRDTSHAKTVNDLKEKHEKDRANMTKTHTEEIKQLKRTHSRTVDTLKSDSDKLIKEMEAEYKRQIESLKETIKKKDNLIQGLERNMVEQLAASQNAADPPAQVIPTPPPAAASKRAPSSKSRNNGSNNRNIITSTIDELNGSSSLDSSTTGTSSTSNSMELMDTMCNGYHSQIDSNNHVAHQNYTRVPLVIDQNQVQEVDHHLVTEIKCDPELSEDQGEPQLDTSSETLDSSILTSPTSSVVDGGSSGVSPSGKKVPKKKEGKFGSGEPGFIFCEICGRLQWYSHMQRRYGCFSCEPCYKFYKRYLANPQQYSCEYESTCSLKISGDRNLASARCKACWLVACKSNFTDGPTRKPRVLDPNSKLGRLAASPKNKKEKPSECSLDSSDGSVSPKKKAKKKSDENEANAETPDTEAGAVVVKKRGRPVKGSEAKSASIRKKSLEDNNSESNDSQTAAVQVKKTGKGSGKRGRPLKRPLFDGADSPSSSLVVNTSSLPSTATSSNSQLSIDLNGRSPTLPLQQLTLHLPPPPGPPHTVTAAHGILYMDVGPPSDPHAQYHLLTANSSTASPSIREISAEEHNAQLTQLNSVHHQYGAEQMHGVDNGNGELKACRLCDEFESLEKGRLISCSTCPLAGHAICLDCPPDLFEKILGMTQWRCPECLPPAN